MIGLLTQVLGRLPIGVLQLLHNPGRLLAAVAGVAFANVLVFVQLGLTGSLDEAVVKPYRLFDPDLLLVSAPNSDGLDDGSNVARARLHQLLAHPEVLDGTGLWVGRAVWLTADGDTSGLAVFAINPLYRDVLRDDLAAPAEHLSLRDSALMDLDTRFVDMSGFAEASPERTVSFEIQGRAMRAVGSFRLGGGFSGDGGLLVSDQTLFRLLPTRSSAAPNHILLRLRPGAPVGRVIDELQALIGPDVVKVQPIEVAMRRASDFQRTQRPTGIIFGFGVFIGVTVGIVIAYQVLATDVADHLHEYATFKAMGYPSGFFVGIILEEALVLGACGFVPGLGLSLAMYDGLANLANSPIFMTTERAVLVFVGTLGACGLSGLLAMRRLAAADPADLF